MQGNDEIEPTTANFTFKHTLEQQETTYEIDLCPSQLRGVSFTLSSQTPMCPVILLDEAFYLGKLQV